MSSRAIAWRMTIFATASTVGLAGASPVRAAPPPVPTAGAEAPPTRVGRLAQTSGTVSFHTADETQWQPTVVNAPFTVGDALWTEQGAHADVDVSANLLALDGQTELDLTALDDHSMVATLPQGDLYLRLDYLPSGDSYTVQTPRGTVQIATAGRYEVVAGDTANPTVVTVVDGAAQVSGSGLGLQVGPRQTATIQGTTTFQGGVGSMAQDPFLTGMLAQEKPAPRQSVSVPPVVQQMTGSAALTRYGSWQATPDYGTVWYPQVADDWVPYRDGQWSYVAPWGWTWVDSSPWGFAPFHYGRWAHIGPRWGWVPVDPGVQSYPTPVYAPALVSFIGLGIGAGLAAGAFAGGHGSVGWVPLGPNEPYYPPYRVNPGYVRQMNFGNVRNVNQVLTDNSIHEHNVQIINNHTTIVQNNFLNRGAATMVPAAAMVGSRPIRSVAQAVPEAQFGQARPIGAEVLRPTAATVGVTPAVARRFNFVPEGRPALPGPAIQAGLARPGAMHGPAAIPALRPANGTPGEALRPGGQQVPGAVVPGRHGPEVAPGATPGLRGPDGRPAGTLGAVVPGQHGSEVVPGANPALRGPDGRPGVTPGAVVPGQHGPEVVPGANPALRGPDGRPDRTPGAVVPGQHGPEVTPGAGGLPGLRGPDARPTGAPEVVRPGVTQAPGVAVPGQHGRETAPGGRGPEVRPGEASRPAGESVTQPHPAGVTPPAMQAPHVEAPHAVEVPHPAETPRPVEAPRAADVPHPAETPHPVQLPRAAEVPHPVEAPRPVQAPRPAEVARPAEPPRMERPPVAPRPEPPRPAPQVHEQPHPGEAHPPGRDEEHH